MVEQRQSAMQRIQVGLVGLVVVLLFVSLANMVLDRVTDAPQDGSVVSEAATGIDDEVTPDEPLAELGVTPVTNEEETTSDTPPAKSQAPASTDR